MATMKLWIIAALVSVTLAQTPHLVLKPATIAKSLGEQVYISCQAIVPNPDLVTDMRWYGPNGQEIPNIDGSIETLEGAEDNTLELYIMKLKEAHTGKYNCTALYSNQRLTADIQIMSYKGIDFQDTESVQKQKNGTDAKIKCHVLSEPPPFVDWLKDGKKLEPNERTIITQDGILIKGIDERDEGVYRCRARVADLGQIEYRDIQVEVIVSPKFTDPPKDMAGVEKESATFNCVATGKPPPKYSWTNPENENVQGKEGYFVDEVVGTLTIIQLEPHHSGKYRCIASNPGGDITAEATLKVHTQPKIEEHRNHTVAAGKKVEMRCIITGEPLPKAIFKKEVNEEPFVNGLNGDRRIEVLQREEDGRRVGILKIDPVERKDDGLYTCMGNSSGGTQESWNHLTVEFPPTFENQRQSEFWTWEGNKVNLTCLATSIPNATIDWYIAHDEVPKNNPNLRTFQNNGEGILEVNPVSGRFFTLYRCEATNTHGTKSYNVTLSQVRKPGPVAGVKAKKITATTIEWIINDPQDDGGRPVIGFNVQYRLLDRGWDEAKTKYWSKGSEPTYLLVGLTPNTEYVFRFSAKNDVDNGDWSGEMRQLMNDYGHPEEPYIYSANPRQVQTVPYSNKYDLQWHVPLDNGHDIDSFQITYYEAKNTSNTWTKVGDFETVEVEYPGDSRYRIDNLSPDKYYKVELRAHNKIGYSDPGEIVFKTAYAQSTNTDAGDGSNAGIIVGILLGIIIFLLIIVDLSCFFLKGFGLTATLYGKRKDNNAKDKEAMIEDGKTSSKEEKSETQVKTVNENTKDVEPTETTPMIAGETDKEKIKKEEAAQQQHVEEESVEEKKETKDSAV